MKLNDEIHINATREQVYAALNDPEILKKSIPGCEEIERTSETELKATVVAKIGPIKAKFKGQVTLSDLNPPESYTISGEGSGGGAGFAKGEAKVSLEENGTSTVLRYEVQAQVGGKLAQLGGRLIDGTVKKLAGDFFISFQEAVSTPVEKNKEVRIDFDTKERIGAGKIYPLAFVLCGLISFFALYLLINNL